MDQLIKDHLKQIHVTDFRIDQYGIYHVYFKDPDLMERSRYFLSGNHFEQFLYNKSGLLIHDLPKSEIIILLDKWKLHLPFTLDLDQLYPR